MTHHICIHDDYITFNSETLPMGKTRIEKDITKVIAEVLEMVVHKIHQDDEVVVCGTGDARRMLGRKLEDRLKKEVRYE